MVCACDKCGVTEFTRREPEQVHIIAKIILNILVVLHDFIFLLLQTLGWKALGRMGHAVITNLMSLVNHPLYQLWLCLGIWLCHKKGCLYALFL